ncbi:MAG: DUF3426 domain-containing protein [Simplicispira sp.]|uniref:DUF3426 domain-containing protein n=1 Tax=Simplicispira sp. TaxID=2015802 RepID=UPI0025832AF6|nr:DUF3426 domain-containing protein [Simplicispira sp.]MDD2690352.1 DUF3426 domain-containing protein [Simplicispira sp.]
MSQTTRCPSCTTIFKVVPDQLRISDGWVRCGQCEQIFDAAEHLQPVPQPPLLPDMAFDSLRSPVALVPRTPEVPQTWGAAVPMQPQPPVPVPAPVPAAVLQVPEVVIPAFLAVSPSPAPVAPALYGAAPLPSDEACDATVVPAPLSAVPVPTPVLDAPPDSTPEPSVEPAPLPPVPVVVPDVPGADVAIAALEVPVAPEVPAVADTPATGVVEAVDFPPAPVPVSVQAETPEQAPAELPGYELPSAAPPELSLEWLEFPEPERAPEPEPDPAPDLELGLKLDLAPEPEPRSEPDPEPGSHPSAVCETTDTTLPDTTALAPLLPGQALAAHRIARPKAARESVPAADTASAATTSGAPAPEAAPGEDEPSFVRAARRKAFWRKPAVRGALALVGVLLCCTWALQMVVHQRHYIAAAQPQWRPLLQALCAPLECVVGPHRDMAAVVVESSSFNRVQGDVYQFAVTLKSRADVPLEAPAVELTLTDVSDQPVLRRVFLPQDFRAPDQLPVQGEWSASLLARLALGNTTVAGYRVLAFYP